MLQFCPIAPMWCARKVDEWRPPGQEWWMCLANFWYIPEYRNYFLSIRAQGGHIILDNGAYEGAMVQDTELLEICRYLGPDVVVLPDVLNNWQKTLLRSDKFFKILQAEGLLKSLETMLVVHCSGTDSMDREEAFESYKAASEMEPSWLGLSRLTQRYWPSSTSFDPFRRMFFISELKNRGFWRADKTHHALGMLNGDSLELEVLADEGIHSCDSSAPIWRGLYGYALGEKDWPNYEYQPLSSIARDLRRAKLNYEEVISRCK